MYSRLTFQLITQTLHGTALASVKQQRHTSLVSERSLAGCKRSSTTQCVVDKGSLAGKSGASGQRKGAGSVGGGLLSPQVKGHFTAWCYHNNRLQTKKKRVAGVCHQSFLGMQVREVQRDDLYQTQSREGKGGEHGKNSSTDDHITD